MSNCLDNYLMRFTDDEKYDSHHDLDIGRIERDEVTQEEIISLENRLIRWYAERAREEKKNIIMYTDIMAYEKLRESGELFEGENMCLLFDRSGKTLMDMSPIVDAFFDTPEGYFYSAFKLQEGQADQGRRY